MSKTHSRVLISGGAGFIGSHLCERFLDDGWDVICLDNFFTGSKDNVRSLLDNPRFELMRHDVTFPLYVEVDEIYNMAWTPPADQDEQPCGTHPLLPQRLALGRCLAERRQRFFIRRLSNLLS